MNFKNWYVSILAAMFLTGIGIPLASAKQLPTVKISDLVTITTDLVGPQAPCSGPDFPIRTIRNPDGNVSPLVIPSDQVLILTGGSWRSFGELTPNRSYYLSLFRITDTNAASFFSGGGAFTDAEGQTSGSFDLGSGVVITEGTTLCGVLQNWGTDDASVFVHLNGYFTKNK